MVAKLKSIIKIVYSALLCVLIAGCSGGGGGTTPAAPVTISGTAATGAALVGVVDVYGSNGGSIVNTQINADGTYTVDVTGLTLPLLIVAVPSNPVLPSQYSAADGPGVTNITPLTSLTIFYANAGDDPSNLILTWQSSAASIIAAIPNSQAAVNANFVNTFSLINSALDIDFTTYDFFTTTFAIGEKIDQILDLLDVNIVGSSLSINVNGSPFLFDALINTGGSGGSTGSVTFSGTGASLLPASFQPDAGSVATIGNVGIASWSSGVFLSPNSMSLLINFDIQSLIVTSIQLIDFNSFNEWSAEEGNLGAFFPTGTINASFDGTTLVFSNDTLEIIDPGTDLPIAGQEIVLNGTITVQ